MCTATEPAATVVPARRWRWYAPGWVMADCDAGSLGTAAQGER